MFNLCICLNVWTLSYGTTFAQLPMTSQSRGLSPEESYFSQEIAHIQIFLTSKPTGGDKWSWRLDQQFALLYDYKSSLIGYLVSEFMVFLVFVFIHGSNFNPNFALHWFGNTVALPFQLWPSEPCTSLYLVSWHTPDFAVCSGWRHEWIQPILCPRLSLIITHILFFVVWSLS